MESATKVRRRLLRLPDVRFGRDGIVLSPHVYALPREVYSSADARIVNGLACTTCLACNFTSKPPGTIEWE
jgi:GMP synthase PP-ATPase subunit